MPGYSFAVHPEKSASDLCVVFEQLSVDQSGNVVSLGCWDFQAGGWKPAYDKARTLLRLARRSTDNKSPDYLTHLMPIPEGVLAELKAMATVYTFADGDRVAAVSHLPAAYLRSLANGN